MDLINHDLSTVLPKKLYTKTHRYDYYRFSGPGKFHPFPFRGYIKIVNMRRPTVLRSESSTNFLLSIGFSLRSEIARPILLAACQKNNAKDIIHRKNRLHKKQKEVSRGMKQSKG